MRLVVWVGDGVVVDELKGVGVGEGFDVGAMFVAVGDDGGGVVSEDPELWGGSVGNGAVAEGVIDEYCEGVAESVGVELGT